MQRKVNGNTVPVPFPVPVEKEVNAATVIAHG
jgi:hypothetical protein